jgi:Cytochrome c7 and related cytochrome c
LILCLGVIGNGEPQRRQQTRRKVVEDRVDYSRFSHTTHVTRQALSCESCHKFPTNNWNQVRQGDSAFPDVAEFPEHSTCLNCHRRQFFARQRPAPAICRNCHVNVTPKDTRRFLFPSLGDVANSAASRKDLMSEFAVSFPHDKHLDVVGLNRRWAKPTFNGFVSIAWQEPKAAKESAEPKSCPVCHQTYQPQGNSDQEYVTKPPADLGDRFWLKKGTFKTVPNSHSFCFTCHNTDAGIAPAPSDCQTCHKLVAQNDLKNDLDPSLVQTMSISDKTVLRAWHNRWSSGTFRHESGEHPNISCLNCHEISTMNTIEPKTLHVPIRSCGGAEGCHITATTDDGGILNYEIDQKKTDPAFVCTKCHLSFGKEAAPETHVKAVQTFKK